MRVKLHDKKGALDSLAKHLGLFHENELVKDKNETEMQIKRVNKSIWQILGVDNLEAHIGTNPVGCVFSEYGQMGPALVGHGAPDLAGERRLGGR